MTESEALAARLRLAIGDRPVDGVARAAGIQRSTLWSLLAGTRKRGPYLDTLRALARACGVRLASLVEEADDGQRP